ncbi:unnamed protein product [Allacma fusca]|uniref:Glycine-rich protein n=1 Tax=Allacma fusca TaxID=39272 RepID=A0A8J2NZU7_9HEXA|nr:unnamed protein product [Allacma fusca]
MKYTALFYMTLLAALVAVVYALPESDDLETAQQFFGGYRGGYGGRGYGGGYGRGGYGGGYGRGGYGGGYGRGGYGGGFGGYGK